MFYLYLVCCFGLLINFGLLVMVCYGVSLWLPYWLCFGGWVVGVCFVLLFALFCCLLYFWFWVCVVWFGILLRVCLLCLSGLFTVFLFFVDYYEVVWGLVLGVLLVGFWF